MKKCVLILWHAQDGDAPLAAGGARGAIYCVATRQRTCSTAKMASVLATMMSRFFQTGLGLA